MASPFNFGGAGGGQNGTGNGASNGSSSNPNQPKPLFGSASGASSPFGQPPATSQPPSSGGIFGGLNSTSSAGNAPGPSIFSGGNTGSNPGSGTSTPSLFGSSTGTAPAGGAFKPVGTGSGSSSIFGGAGQSTPFSTGAFTFGQKKDDAGASTPGANKESGTGGTTTPSIFGGLNKPAGGQSIFGSSTNASTTAPAGSTTPAPSKPFLNFSNSTTPAGPPPTDNTSKPASNNFFGGGSVFGTSKPSDPAQTPATSASPFTASSAPSGGMFGTKPPGSGNTFGNLGSTAPTTSAPAAPTTTASTPAKPTFSFQSSTPASQPTSSAQPASNPFGTPKPGGGSTTPATGGSGFFGGLNKPPTSSAPTSTPSLFTPKNPTTTAPSPTAPAATSTPSLFGSLAGSTPSTTAPATSTQNLFGALGGQTPSSTAPGTSGPASTTAAPSLFGPKPSASGSTQSSAPAAAPSTTAPAPSSTDVTANQPAAGGPGLGNSTNGPNPQSARLKNKTMDEILSRWASDLSKYQSDFKEQAEKVAQWDRLMVDNGDKIQKLYHNTWQAEKDSAEIERQLANVESQQDELAAWLDRYEGEVDEMFARQVGQGETLQGPDQERERTYKLAEKLTSRLDEMGKNLTSMIDAVNEASTTLSKTSKADDPLSHIVRVLNNHLTQLQWIDENAMALQAKVAEAQKVGQGIGSNGYGGAENDLAESFYRSVTRK